MKAFLAYSSKDKILVDAVAKQLGRQFCLYDKYAFKTGEEFVVAIKRCLDQAGVFVLFASINSLSSIWVKLEIDEAYDRKLRKTINHTLVYITDTQTNMDNLPEWMQRALIRKDCVAKRIARDIRFHLDQLLQERRQKYFIGRGADISRFEEMLTPTDGSSHPHIFVITGLPGIGRRTLLKHGAINLLNLHKTVEIRTEEGDSVNDMCAKVADITESFSTVEDFKVAFQEIQRLSKSEALERTVKNLHTLLDGGELPIFVDEGGFLDSEGYITEPVLELVKSIAPNETIYIALVSYRKPQERPDLPFPVLKLNPLAKQDIQRLLQRLANEKDLTLAVNNLVDIAEYVAGYPPSAYFAIQQAKEYGVDLVVKHKHRLVKFRTEVFLRHIEKLGLETIQGVTLQLLSTYSPLPLPTILTVLQIDLEKADELLTNLIDLSLVIADGDGLYRISDPIKEASTNAFGFPSRSTSQIVASSLKDYLGSSLPKQRYLDINRVLFRSANYSGDSALKASAVKLASDLIRLTEEYYHKRQYEQSVNCGRLAVSERPDTVNGRSYLIRALIQLEHWTEAEKEIEELRRFAPPRDIHFLKGLLERRRGNFRTAIAEFEEALRLGRRDAAISRELSQSYYLIGDLNMARQHLQKALQRHGDNRYIVDLWAQLAGALGNEEEARKALERLEVIDRPIFFYFRKSRIEWRFGNIEAAKEAALKALDQEERPPFSIVAQVTLCEIATGHLESATKFLTKLDNEFGHVRMDVKTGLHCRLEIAKSNYSEALRLTDRFVNKESRYYKVIRYEAIKGEIENKQLDKLMKDSYHRELEALSVALGDDLRFDIPDLDSGQS